ncbi:hypothetical protein HYX17_01010 [Candidatus Woesearchaeota archaeon]|nr:hypothetical protein [Candidatus Woesearchaeota archaeon]
MDNQELGNHYFETASIGASSLDNYKKIKLKIQNCGIDIKSLYDREGSLKGLNVKGIGDGTRRILEDILRNGGKTTFSRKFEDIRTEERNFKEIDRKLPIIRQPDYLDEGWFDERNPEFPRGSRYPKPLDFSK